MDTDPKIEIIVEDEATKAFQKGISYTIRYVSFLCFFAVLLIIFDKIDIARMKNIDKETLEFTKFLLGLSDNIVLWFFMILVASYIFKGKGGNKFFEAVGDLITKGTEFYKAKAGSKVGVVINESDKDSGK